MTEVLFPHDDGLLYVAKVLHQYRDRQTGAWQVVGTYSTGPGERHIRAEPAERCRRLPEQQDDPSHPPCA